MKNKIILIYPGIFGGLFPEIPLPLLYVSWALLKEGYDVEIIDMRIQELKLPTDKDHILFVGITAMTGAMINEGLKAAKFIKTIDPFIPIVWGGIHVSLLPEQSLKHSLIDIVVRGEGEVTVVKLANALQENTGLSFVEGISYKKNNIINSNPDRGFMDLNDIDIELPYHLLDIQKYQKKRFPLHTSRGCPYQCQFCYNTVFNKKKWRPKSSEKVLAEIEYLINKFKIDHFDFSWEDEFFISNKRIIEICNGIINKGLDIKWESFCTFNNFSKLTDEQIELIERSGCISLTFGGESGSQKILDHVVKKNQTVEQIIEVCKRIKKTSIRQIISFISGFPTETEKDLDATISLIDQISSISSNVYINGLFYYTPYPGTPLFEIISNEHAYKPPANIEEWANFGIYRNTRNTWHTKKYINKCKTLSILTRFPFHRQKFTIKDVVKVIGGTRFEKFPYNISYYIFANIAILRWKYKFFLFPIEWNILEYILEKKRGFV